MNKVGEIRKIINNIYILNKQGYEIVRISSGEINVCGIIDDNKNIVITISDNKKI
jgi:hypothetical protein